MPRRNPRILFRRQNNLNVSKEPGCEKKGVMVGPTQPHSPRSSNVQYCWVGPCTWLLSSVSSHLHCSHGQVEVKPLAILQWGKSIYSPFKGQFYLCCLYLYPNWTGKSPAGCISVLLTSRGSMFACFPQTAERWRCWGSSVWQQSSLKGGEIVSSRCFSHQGCVVLGISSGVGIWKDSSRSPSCPLASSFSTQISHLLHVAHIRLKHCCWNKPPTSTGFP